MRTGSTRRARCRSIRSAKRRKVCRVGNLRIRRVERSDGGDPLSALLEPGGAVEHSVTLLQDGPPLTRKLDRDNAFGRKACASEEKIPPLLDGTQEVLEAAAFERSRVRTMST